MEGEFLNTDNSGWAKIEVAVKTHTAVNNFFTECSFGFSFRCDNNTYYL
jgi:hypothetical protein